MNRAIVILASTFLFACLGLFIGWLTVDAELRSNPNGTRLSSDLLLMSFGIAPPAGALIGFAVSALVCKMFAPTSPSPSK